MQFVKRNSLLLYLFIYPYKKVRMKRVNGSESHSTCVGFPQPTHSSVGYIRKTNSSQIQRHSSVNKISSQCLQVTVSTQGPKPGQVFCSFSKLP
jgi:hypothetical protein